MLGVAWSPQVKPHNFKCEEDQSVLKNFKTYQFAVDLYRHCQNLKAPHDLRDQLSRASIASPSMAFGGGI